MTIGINATAAIKQPRTGVEEYTYQVIKHLTMLPEARAHRFFLYVPEAKISSSTRPVATGLVQEIKEVSSERSVAESKINLFDFYMPPNFEIKILRWPWPFLWTQIRLAWEMLRRKPDVLFIPVHILPFGAPKNSVVTIHGLEYGYFPQYYSLRRRLYLRWSAARALKRARRIIAISANTKNDLVKLYGGDDKKIAVVHHGVSNKIPNSQFPISKKIPNFNNQISKPYLLYIGRIETKKNIRGILEAYRILKEKYHVPHELVLAGAPGYGYKNLKFKIENLKLKIAELGYVSEDEKQQLLANADIFLFPSFYEGFGIPVLEAQSAGIPVIASANSSLPEVAGEGALFINPDNPSQIAEAVKRIIDDNNLRDKLRQSGFENVKRFSWEKCARETLKIILNL